MFRSIWMSGVAIMAVASGTAHGKSAVPIPAPAAPAPPAPLDGQDRSTDIIITAPIPRSEADVLSGTSVLTGEKLTRLLQPTIGEMLARLPGVSATYFGPNASRPILRGFQGDRVRVLLDGIGSIDASTASVDHAVVINPLIAERIEVLRGPAVLLFGSSAIGGVVNVIDSRIPRSVPENGYRLNGIGTYGSAASEYSGGGSADVKLTDTLVFHADGSYLKTGDLRIPGFALTPERRAEALATSRLPGAVGGDVNFAANAAIRGRLPNTASETWTAGVGVALITDQSNLGISYGRYSSLYGVPIRYATRLGQGEESPRLDVVQDRIDLRGDVQTGGGILESIRFRGAYAAYRHLEIKPDGDIETEFSSKGIEGRVELIQTKRDGWQGASGVQYFNRDFNVVGDEAFLPRNTTSQVGVFTLQQFESGAFKAEAGARYEWTSQSAKTILGDLRFFGGERNFGALSGSLGASYGIAPDVRVGLNLSRTERAPGTEELFSNGAHVGTQAYELGNPNFRLEQSWGLEATLHAHGEGYSLDASAYYNSFSNYISENQVAQAVCELAAAPSGRDVDLPCFQYQQGSARYFGFEIEGSVRLAQIGRYAINLDGLGDYVQATQGRNEPVPRIPAGRLLGGIEAQSDRVTARAEVEHVFEQRRIAQFETPTRDYTLFNASIALQPFNTSRTTLTLSANNLFDVTARRHASFLKDFAPLAGRDVRLTVRFGL